MMMVLYLKELREVRRKMIIALLISAFVGASLPPMFDMFKRTIEMIADISWAESLRQQVEAQAADFELYLWSNWYGKNLPQIIFVFAAILAGPMLAGERASRTFQFLLTKPVSRTQVFLSKYAAGATAIAVISIGGTVAALVAADLSGKPVDTLWFLAPQAAQILGGLCFLSLSLLFSALIDDSVTAGVAAVGAGVALMVADSVGPVRGRLIFGMMAESRSFTAGVPNPVPLLVLAAVAAIVGYAALAVFCRRDV